MALTLTMPAVAPPDFCTTPAADLWTPAAELWTAPAAELWTPAAELWTAPAVELWTAPVAELWTAPVAELWTAPAVELWTAPVAELWTAPAVELWTAPVAELWTAPAVELWTAPVAELWTALESALWSSLTRLISALMVKDMPRNPRGISAPLSWANHMPCVPLQGHQPRAIKRPTLTSGWLTCDTTHRSRMVISCGVPAPTTKSIKRSPCTLIGAPCASWTWTLRPVAALCPGRVL